MNEILVCSVVCEEHEFPRLGSGELLAPNSFPVLIHNWIC
eukprot:COSAG05_NODE_226_length_13453_cov_12.522315_12_plen_40_part_00